MNCLGHSICSSYLIPSSILFVYFIFPSLSIVLTLCGSSPTPSPSPSPSPAPAPSGQLSAAAVAYLKANLYGGSLSSTQLNNINLIVKEAKAAGLTRPQLAYVLATVRLETGSALPVREYVLWDT